MQTDRTIPDNNPDIIIRNNERGISEILKYKDLTTEIESIWNVKTNVILLIIIGATVNILNHPENT